MKWTVKLAYAVGLITTDGSLSIDGRHINLTSKDIEQILTFKSILSLDNKIGIKHNGHKSETTYYQIQFGNVKLYRWLLNIGLTPHKSKTIKELKVPDRFFADFLRGCLDGDGCINHFQDKIYPNSLRLYVTFVSGSRDYLIWVKSKVEDLFGIKGFIGMSGRAYTLRYAKYSSIQLLKVLYYKTNIPCLKRKRYKFEQALDIIRKKAEVV